MCLVVIAWQQHEQYPLILAGNRDEFHARPTQDAHWWPDQPDILAGRDLQAGGTWLALHRNGRFATITNFRDAQHEPASFRSRGHLITEFVAGDESPVDYLESIDGERYAGFNLLAGDNESLAYSSNRDHGVRELGPGIYGLSNALLDSDWFKVHRAKSAMRQLLDNDTVNETELLRLLEDRERAPAASVISERLGFETAHAISAPFIVLPDYGTRSSSAILRDNMGRSRFLERRFNSSGIETGNSKFNA